MTGSTYMGVATSVVVLLLTAGCQTAQPVASTEELLQLSETASAHVTPESSARVPAPQYPRARNAQQAAYQGPRLRRLPAVADGVAQAAYNQPPPAPMGTTPGASELPAPDDLRQPLPAPMGNPMPRPMGNPAPMPLASPGVEVIEAPLATQDPQTDLTPLQLTQVVLSVREHYPMLRSAQVERQIADGKRQSADGAFDLKVKAFSIAEPLGFYDNYRNGIKLEQPLLNGGYLKAGYKLGRGDIEPWYQERASDEGGELSAGFAVPLFKDRAIDARRAEIARTGIARQAVDAAVQIQYLEYVRLGSRQYWEWVAAGQSTLSYRRLLALAKEREEQIEEGIKAGDKAPISRIYNQRLIAKREAKIIEAERKVQKAAIKLSLFLRDSQGMPQLPSSELLPGGFPSIIQPDLSRLPMDIENAIAIRPEIVDLNLQARIARVDLAEAENGTLPRIDYHMEASQDVGKRSSKKGDKKPFELEFGFTGEMPVQRRKAFGKITSVRGKLAQIAVKRQFVIDKVKAMVQDAVSALNAAAGRIDRSEANLRLARETLRLGGIQYEAGDIDLVVLNIFEQAVADAELELIAAKMDYFSALADYQAAIAQTPIDNLNNPAQPGIPRP